MTKLTTHCLDTFSGKPAKGVKVDVYFVSGKREKLNTIVLINDDGQTNLWSKEVLLKKENMNMCFLWEIILKQLLTYLKPHFWMK